MRRVPLENRAQKDKFGSGKHGYQSGNASTGVLATIPGADIFDSFQEEIARVIEAAGISLDGAQYDQLLQALLWHIADGGSLPVSGSYNPNKTYIPGTLIFVDGNWYEAYHPDGCLDKDPRDAANRPSGWTETDVSKPYYWLKIGPWLALPEPGSPIYLPGTTLREGLIKYRNDASLHKSKFWRLAQLYPGLVSGNYINIADLRAEFLRGLDDGRGVDASRVINSAQGDAIREIVGAFTPLYLYDNGKSWGLAPTGATGAFNTGTQTVTYGAGTYGNALANIGDCKSTEFKASRVVPTAAENRPRNVAMLIATRI